MLLKSHLEYTIKMLNIASVDIELTVVYKSIVVNPG
jgi:hypothetical protein